MDVSAEQQTLSRVPVQERIRLGRAVYLHNGSKRFARGKEVSVEISHSLLSVHAQFCGS